jgi:transcription elongation factor GreA
MSDIQYLSKEGLEKMKQELHFMKHEERPRITQAIAEARDKGDLSENAGILESKINQLEHMIANARVLDSSLLDTSKVSIMCNVRVINHNVGKEAVYRLVAESEANLKENKISIKSAIAQGLMGKVVGDVVSIAVPAGIVKLEILEIFI